MQQYRIGIEAVRELTEEFLIDRLGVVVQPSNISVELAPNSGDGKVTGTIRVIVVVDVDLARNPFPYDPGSLPSTPQAG